MVPPVLIPKNLIGPSGPLTPAPSFNLARMPMLGPLFDSTAASLAEDLRPAHDALTTMVTRLGSNPAADVLAEAARPGLAGVYTVEELDEPMIVLMDGSFVFAMLEFMFGGVGTIPAAPLTRALTMTEMKIADGLFLRIGRAMTKGFSGLRALQFRFMRSEPRRDRIEIGRRNAPCIHAQIEVRIGETSGTATIVLPAGLVQSLREDLGHEPADPDIKPDTLWREKFEAEVKKTQMTLRALIRDDSLTLGDISQIAVGQTLQFSVSMADDVTVEANERPLFRCRLGQSGGRYIASITDSIAAALPLDGRSPVHDGRAPVAAIEV